MKLWLFVKLVLLIKTTAAHNFLHVFDVILLFVNIYKYPYFLPRPIQSIGHKVCVFDVCQPRPIIHKLIQSAILCNYAWNIPFMGVYQDLLLWWSIFLHQWLPMYCRIQNTIYKFQWLEYENMPGHKKTSL